ncbi:MAG: phosphoglycerate dehydrogenase [Bacillota bacterium]|jgi:D-3-phosphoglycerate dehydrogenase|uniref:Hydroxyacid dehydrogenase n=1 Tax=Thermanaerosceptrum fracticalcis TaxID=1712410 RepID=A0A7G6E2S5_THEFR|nr:phosphoglycerate dehydrogenase [Thermanaerosceptrum fracticalcis]MBZ4654187.1 Glyoxylate reductase [Peptococcaceae bacterium]QNB46379.1 hydroxyacid dehydrogenase [Thermanaerosceptrum fracticalcis]
MKVLVTALSFGKHSDEPLRILQDAGLEVHKNPLGRPMTEEELCQYIPDYDGLLVGVDPVTTKVLEKGKKLKVVAKHGVGVDNIPLERARELGIKVTNCPDSNSEAVADLTFALMLAVARKIPLADKSTKEGQWLRLTGPELYGKTLGLLGFGAIGRRVALRAKGFSMEVLAYDKYPDEKFARENGVILTGLSEAIEKADFLSLHLPLTPETRNIINKTTLGEMKQGAFLINTARGELINEEDLLLALEEGRLAGAALDAFSPEPPDKNNPLLKLNNVVVSPHIGAYSYEANKRMGMAAAQNLVDALQGKTPPNWVNQ